MRGSIVKVWVLSLERSVRCVIPISNIYNSGVPTIVYEGLHKLLEQVFLRAGTWSGREFKSDTFDWPSMADRRHLEQRKSDSKETKFCCLPNGLAELLGQAFRIVKAG